MAAFLAWHLPSPLKDVAQVFLLPLAGIFIGLTFAWAANAQSLLADQDIEELADNYEGDFEDYVYTMQLAVLAVFVTTVGWGVAGLGFFDDVWPKPGQLLSYRIISSCLLLLAGLALRECWQVVLFASDLILQRRKMRALRTNQGGGSRGRK